MGAHSTGARWGMTRYMIDRLVTGRRVRFSTRARSKTEHRQRISVVDRLVHEGLFDWLEALEQGRVSWGEVLHAQRTGQLQRPIAGVYLRRPLGELLTALPLHYQSKLRLWLTALGLPDTRPLGALSAESWSGLVAGWPYSGAHWNHGRRALSRLLTLLLGKHHPERHALLAHVPIYEERPRLVSLPHENLAAALDHAHPEDRPALVALTVTGLRTGELWSADTMIDANGILHVAGTKTATSRRCFPVGPLTRALLSPGAGWPSADSVRRRWAARRPVELRLHDLRHIAAQAAETLGIPEGRRRHWMGHAPPTIHSRYTQAAWTAEDAAQLEGYWIARGLLQ